MITELALLIVGAVLASEILIRLPLMQQLSVVMGTAQRSAATMRSKRISDHWKQAVLSAYSLRIVARSLFFFLLLCLVLSPLALIGLLAPGGFANWLEVLIRPFAIAVLCICSILYILVRTRMSRG